MQITQLSLCLAAAATISIALLGCGGSSTQGTSKGTPSSPTSTAHENDEHGDHTDHDDGEPGHPSEGPHHGHLIELGNEEYHAELLHDDNTHTVTVYILDGTAKNEVAVAENAVTVNVVVAGEPTQLKMSPANATDGMASKFQLISYKLHEALESDKDLNGRLNVTIQGKPYVGQIEHHAHEDDDHKNDH